MGTSTSTLATSPPSSNPPPSSSSSSDSACPVDPATRQAYLDAAAAAAPPASSSDLPDPTPRPPKHPNPKSIFAYGVPTSFLLPPPQPQPRQSQPPKHHPQTLAETRQTSTIPRALAHPFHTSTISANAQTPTPTPPTTTDEENWIYPSEKQFYEAMARKNHSPRATDMAAIVPIHNAVNERAWYLIREWERRFASSSSPSSSSLPASSSMIKMGPSGGGGGKSDGDEDAVVERGPRLRSFAGDAGKLSPRARWLGLWGYERPFDRHDWVVERPRPSPPPSSLPSLEKQNAETAAGDGLTTTAAATAVHQNKNDESKTAEVEVIEYLIDFYRGRESERGGGKMGGVNFYLDVRPKLNSWEGWRMRWRRFWGVGMVEE